jgi:Cell division protein FtsL.
MATSARVLRERSRETSIVMKSSRAEGKVAKEERNERVAHAKKRRQLTFIFMAIAVLMALQIVQREMIVRNSYELVSVKSQVNSLQKENEFLRIELASLNSPDRIQAAATSQLGMVVPDRVHYVQAIPDNNDATGVARLSR